MHNFCFMSFANILLLAVYFICILDYGNDVRQKQIQAIFLLEFKWVINHQRKFTNINKIFGPETVNRHTVQWWFKKFCKGDESLEDEWCSGWPLDVDNDELGVREIGVFRHVAPTRGYVSNFFVRLASS